MSGKKRAVLVGINYVGKHNALNGCVNDALAIRELLMQQYGYVDKDIRVLIDENPTVDKVKVDSLMPTRAAIMESFEWLLKDAERGDQLVFTFSGHGVQAKDANGDEADGNDECFLFLDGILIDDDFAKQVLMRVPEGVKLTVVTDCCHSATICDMRFCYWMDSTNKIQILHDKRGVLPVGDIINISAALDAQAASDGKFAGKWVFLPNGKRKWEWEDSHGAFTWSLLKVLESVQFRPVPAHQILTTVNDYIQKTLKKTQVPHISVSREMLIHSSLF